MLLDMNALLPRSMTREDFFTWAERQDGKYEFDGFQPVAMVGGNNNHGTISSNLIGQLYMRLRGQRCRPMSSEGGGVATVGNTVRYPDATVTCSPIIGTERLVPNPVIVFEVLSASTAHDDTTIKKIECQAVPTIRRYVLISQTKAAVTVYYRPGEGMWESTPPLEAGALLELPEIGIAIPVDELYERMAFTD
jgi:Uma2 family endonuclease